MIRRLRALPDEAGLSLTELIVAMVVTAIALSIITTFAVSTMRSLSTDKDAHQATSGAANALNEMGRVIRSAATNPTSTGADPAIASGSTAASMTVTSYVDTSGTDPKPTRATFTIDGIGNLIEQRITPVADGGFWSFTRTGITTSTRTFTGPFTKTVDPVFVYLDTDGAEVAAPLTDATAPTVTSVRVTITGTHVGRAASDPVQLTTTAVMPNLALD